MSVSKQRSNKKKREEVKQNFLERISRIDRKEIEKILHEKTKPRKAIQIFRMVTEEELKEKDYDADVAFKYSNNS